MPAISRCISASVLSLTLAACTVAANDPAARADKGTAVASEVGPDLHYTAELIRTEGGIAHITAPDFGGVGFGLAYAYAQDNICMLADHLLTVRGERARYFGPDALATASVHGEYAAQVQYTIGLHNAESDFFYRSYLDTATLARANAQATPEARALLSGYVAGYNHYLAQHRTTLPTACHDAAWVQPMTLEDMQRLVAEKAIHASGEYFRNAVLGAAPPHTPNTVAVSSAVTDAHQHARTAWLAALASTELGSNALAVGASLSDNGRGLLLANPHFPWMGPDRFYEAHLTVPGRYDAMGATLGGLPIIVIGFNRTVAWTHTVSTAKHFALYRLTLDPDDATHTHYLQDGKRIAMQRQDVTIDVRDPNGALTARTHTFYETPFGAVVAAPALGLTWDARHAYVLSDMNRENGRMIDQWLAFGQAHDVADIRRADQQFAAMPWVNTIAADKAGTALFEDASVVPNIVPALATKGCVVDPTFFVLDGTRSACGATSDLTATRAVGPESIFAQHVPRLRHPHLERRDFVANSNDSYWLANPAAPITGILPIFGKEDVPQSLRTRFAFDRIAARRDGRDGMPGKQFSIASFDHLLFDSDVYAAHLLKPSIVAVCHAAKETTSSVMQACDILAHWDGHADTTSAGAPLFRLLWLHLAQVKDLWAVPFDPQQAMTTPRGLNPLAAPEVMTALQATVDDMHARGMPLDATLAPYQYASVRDIRVPLAGGPGEDGIYNVIATGTKYDRHLFGEVQSGSSYIQLVSFDAQGPTAKALLTYGQSTDPLSPYFGDQIRWFAAHRWVSLPFTSEDVLAHAHGDVSRVAN